jgi:hypothetical protein
LTKRFKYVNTIYMSGNGEPISGAGGEPVAAKPGVDTVGSQPGKTDTLFGVDSSSWAGVPAPAAEAGRPPLKPDARGVMLNPTKFHTERFFTGDPSESEGIRGRLMTRLEAELSQITRERAGLDLKGDVLRYAAEIGDSNLFEAVSSGSSVTDVLKAVVETKEPGVEPVIADPVATGLPSADMEKYYPASHIGTEPTTTAAPTPPLAEAPKGNPQ